MQLTESTASVLTPDIQHRLPTNTLSKSKRLHRWGSFIAGYSIEFVEECLRRQKTGRSESIVLDPFSGCGTTLLGARNLGFQTVGYELHPVFHSISNGKLTTYEPSDLERVIEQLQAASDPIVWSEDAKKFLTKLFTPSNLRSIETAAESIKHIDCELHDLSVTVFLKACEYSCGSQTDGVYKAPTTKKTHIPFDQALKKASEEFSDDLLSEWYSTHWCATSPSTLYNKSAVKMLELKPSSINYCITSPPYLNNFDYAEMTRMHLYLLGWCKNWGEISSSVRNSLITNTTTALKDKKSNDFQSKARSSLPKRLIPLLDQIVADLSVQKKTRAGKKDYNYLVYPYYSEIMQVLSGVYHALKPGGEVHWVVADSALYGIHIETHEHTATIMRELGYQNVQVHYMRRRGHRWILSKRDGSKKGLGEYRIEATK